MQITAAIITFNEEKNIVGAIESVRWADKIIVVDSESTDRTRELACSAGAIVYVNKWPGFAAQKQFAVDHAENDWVFSLDADERVSQKLRDEIIALRGSEEAADGYKIPRMAIYMGREIRHGGWYPDWQLRLFNRRKGRWKQVPVHESVEMDGGSTVRKLKGEIIHYSVEDAAHHHRMIGERYAPLAAEKMFADGRRTSPLRTVAAGIGAFFRAYVLKAGFLDGFAGLCIAYFAGHHAVMKNLVLLERQRAADAAASRR